MPFLVRSSAGHASKAWFLAVFLLTFSGTAVWTGALPGVEPKMGQVLLVIFLT